MRQVLSRAVGDGGMPPAPLRDPDVFRVQQVRARPPIARRIRGELHDGQPGFGGADGRAQRPSDDDGHRVRQPLGQLPEELAALVAEDAAPDAIEVDRDDGHVEPFDNALEPALERQQVAGARDRAFREDAHNVAGGELGARVLDGLHDLTAVARRDGNRVELAHEPVQAAQPEVRVRRPGTAPSD